VTVYGQTEVTRDLYAAREAPGRADRLRDEDVAIHDAETDAPYVTYTVGRRGPAARLRFRGRLRRLSRRQPRDHSAKMSAREYEKVYPFGWLGILSRRRRSTTS
jgi:p-hydroxybenzoate 3-monooxygenase